jgi:malonyl-CoA O-methyltransferase
VPCTALALPSAEDLLAAAREEGLALHQALRLRFSRPGTGGKEGLRALRRLGAGASPSAPLSAGELRRLLRHWPTGSSLTWEVLLLVGRRPGNTDSGGTNHGNGDAGERRCGW